MNSDFINIPVDDKDLGKRIDIILAEKYPTFSRNQFQKLIIQENVTFNDATVTNRSIKINNLGILRIQIPKNKKLETKPENIPIDIVFEDNNILIVNKSAGMVVHPSSGNQEHTLVNALLFHCKNSLSGIGGIERPGIVHRLDKMTSGLILIAKDNKSHLNISEQFRLRKIKKTYKAFAWNRLYKSTDQVNTKIIRCCTNRKKMMANNNKGKDAITDYRVLKEYYFNNDSYVSFLSINLRTGRTHQIRVHMNYLGNSLIGDDLYKEKKTKIKREMPMRLKEIIEGLEKNGRQALHASYLSFSHPLTNETMSFKSPLPKDLSDLKKELELIS